MWHHDSMKMDAFHRCEQYVTLVILEHTRGPWLLSGVYVSTEYREQRVLWFEISKMVSQGLSSLIIEDFNYIIGSHEKRVGRQHCGQH